MVNWMTSIDALPSKNQALCNYCTFASKLKYYWYFNCDRVWENRSYCRNNWYPFFVCTWKLHSCTTQKHQVLDHRWPGLLLQTAFYRCCQTTRVHFMALKGLHGIPGCSSRQSWPPLWILPVCVPYWGHNTAAWAQMVALAHLRLPTLPPIPLPPTPYRLNPWYYRHWKKLSKKSAAFK